MMSAGKYAALRAALTEWFACAEASPRRMWFLLMTAMVGAAALAEANGAQAQSAPLPTSFTANRSTGATMQLAVNDQRMLQMSNVRRVAVGDPTVADVVPVNGGVLVVAKKPGTTTVSVWSAGNATPVLTHVEVRSAIAAAVLPKTGSVNVYGNTAVISGHFDSNDEHQAALAVARQSVSAQSGPTSSSSSTGGAAAPSGVPLPGAAPTGGGGSSGNPAPSAAPGDAGQVIDRSTVGSGGVVQVDVKVVQFSKTVLKEAGFNLFSSSSNGFGFGVFTPSSLTSYTASSNSLSFGSTVSTAMSTAFNLVAGPFGNGLFANLSVLETNGLARVLAEPTLLALSGQSASFLAGGEIPIPQSGGLGTTTIVYKSFGVGLTVTPTVLGPNTIALKVAPEASELDYTHELTISGTSIPAITTRRADTTVELGDGESFVIGGLVSRTTVASVNKVPGLADIPILGAFFKSLSYSQDDEELVIVVTPHLVKPIARGVALTLPGQDRDSNTNPVWSSFLRGPGSGSDLPGFSR